MTPDCHPGLLPPVEAGMTPFLAWPLALLLGWSAPTHAGDARLIVQSSPLAGFQFYAGRELWDDMRIGDALQLVREADNAHDVNAVRVLWQGRVLGYVPRRENAHVAQQLDRGTPVRARIVKLTPHRSPWRRMEFEVYVEL